MKILKLFAVFCMGALCCTSCLRTAYYVGSARPSDRMVKVGQESFHHHYIAGLVSGKNATIECEEYAGKADNYAVRTSLSFLDLLIGNLTFSIYTPTKTTWFMSVDEINKLSNTKNKEQK